MTEKYFDQDELNDQLDAITRLADATGKPLGEVRALYNDLKALRPGATAATILVDAKDKFPHYFYEKAGKQPAGEAPSGSAKEEEEGPRALPDWFQRGISDGSKAAMERVLRNGENPFAARTRDRTLQNLLCRFEPALARKMNTAADTPMPRDLLEDFISSAQKMVARDKKLRDFAVDAWLQS